MIKMIGCFIGGVFVGGFIGVMIMCVLSVAGNSDCDIGDDIIQYDGANVKDEQDKKANNDNYK